MAALPNQKKVPRVHLVFLYGLEYRWEVSRV